MVAAILGCLAGCGGPPPVGGDSRWHERPVHYGVALPYPTKISPHETIIGAHPSTNVEITVPARLTVDSLGRVASIEPKNPALSIFCAYFGRYLRAIQFEPGTVDGVPSSLRIPVNLHIRPDLGEPTVVFPVAGNRAVRSPQLYTEALQLNDVIPAALTRMPSYNCDLTPGDTTDMYPYLVIRVDLDATGAVRGMSKIVSTFPQFTGQLMSALYWAEYAPLIVRGEARASSLYVVVSFYPTVRYPTLPITPDSADSLSILERMRVYTAVDTLGLLAPPVPMRTWSGVASMSPAKWLEPGVISVPLTVDASGRADLGEPSRDSRAAKRTRNSLAQTLRFYPAIGFDGVRRPYTGVAYFEAAGGSNIRIWFDWLPRPRFDDN
ncbi:MAG: hypothetical protein KKA42_16165 [candidate division Zixibacteria bacterium]|nr:hypothetical protein [candidate division Zixibacteria bacterium]